jgi:hypothetical protein
LGDKQEDECKSPDFQVECWAEEFDEVKGLGVCVCAVTVEAAEDEGAFPLVEEAPGVVALVREVDDEDHAADADDEGQLGGVSLLLVEGVELTYHSLHDENPLPSIKTLERRHLTEAIGENTREGRSDASNKVEEGVALLDLVYRR